MRARKPQARSWWPRLALVGAWLVLVRTLWFVCDDAFISFRYARNAARGHGLRYNLGDQLPVEGYSNFGWTALAAIVESIGADPAAVMPVLSAACGLALLLTVDRASRRLDLGHAGGLAAMAMLALSPSIAAWSTGGLATMPMALLLFVLFDQLVLDDSDAAWARAALAAVGLTLVRTEGIGWVVVVSGIAVAVRGRAHWRAIATLAGLSLLVWGTHGSWRYLTYGDWVANTARAKVGMSPDRIVRGLVYVAGTGVALVTPLVGLLATPALASRGRQGLAVAAMAWGVPVFCVLVGGDYMAFGRMWVAGLAFGALAVGAMVQRLQRPAPRVLVALVVLAGALPAGGYDLMPAALRKPLFFRPTTPWIKTEHGMWRAMRSNAEKWAGQGRALAAIGRPDASLVTGAIGARGYFSDLFIFDRGGLVTRGLSEGGRDDPSRHSPGHDIIASRGIFLEHEPTWLRFADVTAKGETRPLLKELTSWRVPEAWRGSYGPRVYTVSVDKPHHVLVLERASSPEEAAAWWDAWPEHALAAAAAAAELRGSSAGR